MFIVIHTLIVYLQKISKELMNHILLIKSMILVMLLNTTFFFASEVHTSESAPDPVDAIIHHVKDANEFHIISLFH